MATALARAECAATAALQWGSQDRWSPTPEAAIRACVLTARPSRLVDGAPTPSSPEIVPVKLTSTWDWRVLLTLLMQTASAEGLVQGRTWTFGEQLLVVLGEMASAAKAKVLSHLCDRVDPSGVA